VVFLADPGTLLDLWTLNQRPDFIEYMTAVNAGLNAQRDE
jgi:hypothetical protein